MEISTGLFILCVIFQTSTGIFADKLKVDVKKLGITGRGAEKHFSTAEELERFGITLKNLELMYKVGLIYVFYDVLKVITKENLAILSEPFFDRTDEKYFVQT